MCRAHKLRKFKLADHLWTLFKDKSTDHTADFRDIAIGGELKFHLSKAAEPQLQLTVQVKGSRCFHGKGLDFAVGKGGKILFLAGDPLHVDGENPFIGEHNTVPDALIGGENLFPVSKHGSNHGAETFGVHCFEL